MSILRAERPPSNTLCQMMFEKEVILFVSLCRKAGPEEQRENKVWFSDQSHILFTASEAVGLSLNHTLSQ